MKNTGELKINIARSTIGGTSVWFIDIFVIIFMYILVGVFMFIFSYFADRYAPALMDWCELAALIAAFLLSALIFGGRFGGVLENKLGGRGQELGVMLEEDFVRLEQGRWRWVVPYREIVEVGKIMVINNRFYTEKGKYRIKIKRKGHRALVFLSTWEEYNKHLDFEDTELSRLYYGLKGHGVKCC